MRRIFIFSSIGIIFLLLLIMGKFIFTTANGITEAVETEQNNAIIEENIEPIVSEEIKEEQEVENTEEKRTTILILGSDQRKNERARSDTMIVAQYIHNEKKAYLISIPRDSKIQLKDKGTQKINAAYAFGGPELAVETVEEILNIQIDGYIVTNFNGFKEISEALNGVTVNNKKEIVWYDQEGNKKFVIPVGKQRLKGDNLLMYVRFRGDSEGDFGRINRQQEVIKSVIQEVLNPKNIFKMQQIVKAVQNNTKTNINFGEFLNLAWQIKDVDNIEIEPLTLKTKSQKSNGIWYEIMDTEDLKRISNILNGIPIEDTDGSENHYTE